MNILIVNDDGIEARGIGELINRLSGLDDIKVYVCAPDGQRSATGHGITIRDPIVVREAVMNRVELAYVTSGLPADCVKIGFEMLHRAGIPIHMVFSGINHGANLGTDTLYSGTVAGAIEGSINGVPSVAVSVCSHEAEYFELACDLAEKATLSLRKKIEDGTADHTTVLNINSPNLPKDQVKGIKYTRLGPREYNDEFSDVGTEQNAYVPGEFRYRGTPVYYEDLPLEMDVMAVQEGYACITPLHTDMTDYEKIEEIKSWGLE